MPSISEALNDVVILPALAKSGIGCFNPIPKIYLLHRRIVLPIGGSESCITDLRMQSRMYGTGCNKRDIFAAFEEVRPNILATANSAARSPLFRDVPRSSNSVFKLQEKRQIPCWRSSISLQSVSKPFPEDTRSILSRSLGAKGRIGGGSFCDPDCAKSARAHHQHLKPHTNRTGRAKA